MKKIVDILCAAVFLLCVVILLCLTLITAYSKPVIGGVGLHTVLFSFRQVLFSPEGASISVVGITALVALTVRNR